MLKEHKEHRLPNVVLIMTDQQRADYLGCAGHPILQTPHIDALAKGGVRFDRCYVASPVCMPNRSSIMTGRMPSAHRARMNGIPLSLQENTFVDLLRMRGYRTSLVGKSHLQNMIDKPPLVTKVHRSERNWVCPTTDNEAVRSHSSEDYGQELPSRWLVEAPFMVKTPFYGFEHVVLCTGHGDMVGGHYHQWMRDKGHDLAKLQGPHNALPSDRVCPQAWRTRVPEELYPTRFIANEACLFLERHAAQAGDQPFFLQVSFPDPHHPFTPPGRYWDMYSAKQQSVPLSSYCADDVLPQIAWARRKRSDDPVSAAGYSAFAATKQEIKEAMALTCGMITMIDDAVGSMMRTLREQGMDDNTIVVFTSDHGDYLGDHGLMLKGPLHLQSVLRVPLVWRDPSAPGLGRVESGLCSSIDISATILDRVGIEPYNGMQGQSLMPMVKAQTRLGREAVLIEEDAQAIHFGFSRAPRIRTLITEQYRISVYGRSGHVELFDLVNDPDEMTNLWSRSDMLPVRASLMEELAMAEMDADDTSPWPKYCA